MKTIHPYIQGSMNAPGKFKKSYSRLWSLIICGNSCKKCCLMHLSIIKTFVFALWIFVLCIWWYYKEKQITLCTYEPMYMLHNISISCTSDDLTYKSRLSIPPFYGSYCALTDVRSSIWTLTTFKIITNQLELFVLKSIKYTVTRTVN